MKINSIRTWLSLLYCLSMAWWVYFLRLKSEILLHGLVRFVNEVYTPVGISLFCLHLDSVGEFFSEEMTRYCAAVGIRLDPTPAYHHHLSGVAEVFFCCCAFCNDGQTYERYVASSSFLLMVSLHCICLPHLEPLFLIPQLAYSTAKMGWHYRRRQRLPHLEIRCYRLCQFSSY